MRGEAFLEKPMLRFAVLASGYLLMGAPLDAQPERLANRSLLISLDRGGALYRVAARDGARQPILTARVGAQIDGQWVRSTDYPRCRSGEAAFSDALGAGRQLTVSCSRLPARPDLSYQIQLYEQHPYAAIQVDVSNHPAKPVTVRSIRSVEAAGQPLVGLPGPAAADRILSDSYSEDWPRLAIYDLGKGPRQMHRAAWSQVIYNRETKQSWFVGALSANRFLTLIHLGYEGSDDPRITTGTTELQREYSLRQGSANQIIELSLPLDPGQSMASERVMLAAGPDYLGHLAAYGEAFAPCTTLEYRLRT
jgi:alpha-galactosidase